jgi:hypothetical protein
MNTTIWEECVLTLSELEAYTLQVNDKCVALQEEEKEIVSHDSAYEAYATIKNMKIEDAGDALLYCASMNMLNTYVKQRNSKIGYGFKEDIHYMTSVLLNLDVNDVFIDFQDEQSLLVVQIFAIQFSFHYVKKKHEIIMLCNSHHHKELPWDGIRKQKCSVTLYELIKENTIRTCGITYRGKPLKEKIARMMEVYQCGKSTFEDLLRF